MVGCCREAAITVLDAGAIEFSQLNRWLKFHMPKIFVVEVFGDTGYF